MNSERYRQVARLYQAALDLDPDERAAFLDAVCGVDEELRREVESLLAAEQPAADYFAVTALEAAASLLPKHQIASLIGRCISHYQIISLLGAGGMSEVYLALDTRLGRKVALKMLPEEFTRDEERVKRFDREARAASALNHPNIITIYEIGWAEGRNFIATEYIEGQTLRQQMTCGPMEIGSALDVAVQTSMALAAAHEVGIVHRDIKPENIMMRRDGLIKVLDFGLAKLLERRPSANAVAAAESEAKTGIKTLPGLVMGTPQYMSPEQVRGIEVEARSDIFSLGVVLYEMVAGNRPFTGKTPSDVMAAILERELMPLARSTQGMPDLDRIVRKALAKKLEDRYQKVGELQRELKNLQYLLESRAILPQITCPQCRQENPAAHLFCGKCGSSLTATEEMPTISNLVTRPIQPLENERRQAAVVCSSLFGYAGLVEQLASEEVEQIVANVKTAVVEIVERHGGMVMQLTGDEITALFGIPATYEDHFVRAVRASLEFHARVRELTGEYERRFKQMIRLCTGVSTGPVVAQHQAGSGEKYRVTGEALQIAAKLAAQAESDEILVGEETRRLVAPFFKTEHGRPLPLKPKSGLVMSYRVLCESGAQTRLEAAQSLGLTRYTGREKELSTLQDIYDRALKGEGQFVSVVGEAGAGKSRLLLEFRRSLKEKPATILQGRCESYGGNIPYQPFIDVLRDALNLQENDSPAGLLLRAVEGIRAIDTDLEIYIPLYLHLLSLPSEEYPLPEPMQGADLRLAILEGLSAIFTLGTNRGPSLMLLEDWHWADEASEEALKKLVRMAADYPLIIIVTCRPERSFDSAYLNHHTQLYLGPLGAAHSVSIVKAILKADVLPEGLGDLLFRRTGGNPFFIEEVCLTSMENGRIMVVDGEAKLNGSLEEFDLPDTVQAVIRARLDRLDQETRKALRHASVIGHEFSRPILELTFESRHRLSQCLEKLQSLGLIHQVRVLPEAAYQFNHMLTQEVVYDSMLLHQRRSLHEAVGRAIEDLSRERIEERFDLLAYHFSRAENWAKAVTYGREAAKRAVRLIRFTEALGTLEKVEGWILKLPNTEEHKNTLVHVLLAQERLCETLGLREQQQSFIDRTLSLLDPESDQALLAEVYIRQGELYTLLQRYADAERLLNESLAIQQSLADRVGERRTLRSLGFLCWQEGRNDEAMSYTRSALEMDREMNDAAGYMQDLTNIGALLRARGEPQKALEFLEEAEQLSVTLGRYSFQVYALGILANAHRDLGEIEKAIQMLEEGIEIARQNQMPVAQMINTKNLAGLCWEQGRSEECLRLCQELVSLIRSLDIKGELAQALKVCGQRLLEIGRVQEARPVLAEAADLFSQLGDREMELLSLTSLMTALKRLGRQVRKEGEGQEPALRYYQEALDIAAGTGDKAQMGDLLNTMGIVEWERANYGRALEHYENARQVFEELGDRVNTGLIMSSIGATLKAMGQFDKAKSHLEEAITILHASKQRLFEGHALAALGDVLSETGLFERAADQYNASLKLRREIGDRQGEGWMLHHLAQVYARTEPERSRELLDQALTIAGEIGSEQLQEACGHLSG
jgi:serine/threonine protein kinase/tetratricopeptide (TPR) repeat protein